MKMIDDVMRMPGRGIPQTVLTIVSTILTNLGQAKNTTYTKTLKHYQLTTASGRQRVRISVVQNRAPSNPSTLGVYLYHIIYVYLVYIISNLLLYRRKGDNSCAFSRKRETCCSPRFVKRKIYISLVYCTY